MTPYDVSVKLDRGSSVYLPGEELVGHCSWDSNGPAAANAMELSVLWHTEGKGTEDLGVIFFEKWTQEDGELPLPRRPRRFAVRLPAQPLSYDGVLVKILWCVRARLFLADGEVRTAEAPFQLGKVARAREIVT